MTRGIWNVLLTLALTFGASMMVCDAFAPPPRCPITSFQRRYMADSPTVEALTDEQKKEHVRSTWKAVQGALGVDATKLFYQRLFEQYPSVEPLFANSNMENQALHLYDTVSLAVDSLDDMTGLVPVLKDLGSRHATRYHTELPHYEAVGATLLWTLETGLGPEVWTPPVAESWAWVFGVIAEIMKEGAIEVGDE
eukprot:scaffold2257_cov169-Amphora_coffeaeformis.AAC.16